MFEHKPSGELDPLQPSVPAAPRVGEAAGHGDSRAGAMFLGPGSGSLDSVVAAMGHWASDSDISLDHNKPPRLPAGPKIPFGDAVNQQGARLEAEALLTKNAGLDTGKNATKAMNLLLRLPAAERGPVLDALDTNAFDNLLTRLSPHEREQLAGFVQGSKNPERRLRLWGESHKSKASNEVKRRKGDIGPKKSRRKNRTDEQNRRRRKHHRRRRAAKDTHKEVDRETAILMKKAKAGTLTLDEVDALRTRKDFEHGLELQHNINFTNQKAKRKDGSQVVWTKQELSHVSASLSQLPDAHAGNPKGFETLHRVRTEGPGIGASHVGDEIRVADAGAKEKDGYIHGGDRREMVTGDMRQKHGSKIGTLEYVMTHEVGHDVADHQKKAFKKFQAAAGWGKATEGDIDGSGLSDRKKGDAKADQRQVPAARGDYTDGDKTYRAAGGTRYHVRDTASIPTRNEATRGVAPDSWKYARTNPGEHFAETYAKAVHVPESLHADLVGLPQARLDQAQADLAAARQALKKRSASQQAPARGELAALRAEVSKLEKNAARAQTAVTQRGKQFHIMRDDVFGTDKAVAAAEDRLRARGATNKAIAAFRARAARASTPKQVEMLEGEVAP